MCIAVMSLSQPSGAGARDARTNPGSGQLCKETKDKEEVLGSRRVVNVLERREKLVVVMSVYVDVSVLVFAVMSSIPTLRGRGRGTRPTTNYTKEHNYQSTKG